MVTCWMGVYFNPLSQRRGRRHGFCTCPVLERFQSTLPAKGETSLADHHLDNLKISIHSPSEGRDTAMAIFAANAGLFQSTLPAKGETISSGVSQLCRIFQSTLPAKGETKMKKYNLSNIIFQSTLPAKGETFTLDGYSHEGI